MRWKEPVLEDSSWSPLGIRTGVHCEQQKPIGLRTLFCGIYGHRSFPETKPNVLLSSLLNARIWLVFKVQSYCVYSGLPQHGATACDYPSSERRDLMIAGFTASKTPPVRLRSLADAWRTFRSAFSATGARWSGFVCKYQGGLGLSTVPGEAAPCWEERHLD
ncbi:uncharacterized protein O9250_003943 [Rhynochetos jubatus]